MADRKNAKGETLSDFEQHALAYANGVPEETPLDMDAFLSYLHASNFIDRHADLCVEDGHLECTWRDGANPMADWTTLRHLYAIQYMIDRIADFWQRVKNMLWTCPKKD